MLSRCVRDDVTYLRAVQATSPLSSNSPLQKSLPIEDRTYINLCNARIQVEMYPHARCAGRIFVDLDMGDVKIHMNLDGS